MKKVEGVMQSVEGEMKKLSGVSPAGQQRKSLSSEQRLPYNGC